MKEKILTTKKNGMLVLLLTLVLYLAAVGLCIYGAFRIDQGKSPILLIIAILWLSAIIDARKMIVDGAVGMVEMALDRLSEKDVVELDEERKAAMVSNLLVVLCGNRDAQPIVNSGSLY